MAKYLIETDSVKSLGGKVGMTVTFIDELNGKEDKTCYHEVESVDKDVIGVELSKAALEYESREATMAGAPTLVEGKAVKAVAVEEVALN